jgi:hypothetical protein
MTVRLLKDLAESVLSEGKTDAVARQQARRFGAQLKNEFCLR